MYQAKWKDRTFSITSNTIRTLTELGTGYKIEKTTNETISITVKNPSIVIITLHFPITNF